MQRGEFSQDTRITAMLDRSEIVRIEFREERVRDSQAGIMHTKMLFEDLTAPANSLKAFADGGGATIVPAQIGQGLFALKYRGRSYPVRIGSIGGDIGTISAARQTDLERASGIALRLLPRARSGA